MKPSNKQLMSIQNQRPDDADKACQLLQHLHQSSFEMVVITKSVATIAQSLLCETNSIDLSG